MANIDWKTAVRSASRTLNLVSEEKKNEVLMALAAATENHIDDILKANAEDLSKMDKSDSMYDRLLLTEERLKGIASDIRKVATLPSPLNKVLEQRTLPNGLELKKVSVPFGVIGIIYEARPNVSFDVFSLCFKSGNACVLKGGTNAHASNSAIVALIKDVLKVNGIDENVVHLMPAGRESTAELL
ncbi:MAG: aldehyde dehydrogenase family protein, partial [Paludibacteraceae bacterium]|nr:aldehyde dehydrogenase family protein [Paludibacteraceae bacterium]